jgi:hypothetical protein
MISENFGDAPGNLKTQLAQQHLILERAPEEKMSFGLPTTISWIIQLLIHAERRVGRQNSQMMLQKTCN